MGEVVSLDPLTGAATLFDTADIISEEAVRCVRVCARAGCGVARVSQCAYLRQHLEVLKKSDERRARREAVEQELARIAAYASLR